MFEEELERVLFDFIEGRYDVFVCIIIIEFGVDMLNVNIFIVEDSDRFGFVQFYQLRGRVGWFNRLVYVYFIFRKDKVFFEQVQKRFVVIKEFIEFGLGFKIVMRDFEIRGVGFVFGKFQYGYINSVGYDMYIRFFLEEIRRFKGENIQLEIEFQIDVKVSVFISSSYIDDEKERINMYKKILLIELKDDVNDIYDELIDRFGDVFKEVDNLIKIVYLKCLCKKVGIISILQF